MKEDGCSNIDQNLDQDEQSILLAMVEARRVQLMELAILCFVAVQLPLEQETVLHQVDGEDHLQKLDGPGCLMPHSFLHLLPPPPPLLSAVLCRPRAHPSHWDTLTRGDSVLVVPKNKLEEARPHVIG